MTALVTVSSLFGHEAARRVSFDFSALVTVRCHLVFTATQYLT